jgi:hypothetical protein
VAPFTAARHDRLDGVQAGVHHDNIKKSVARMENEKAAKEVELQQARNSEANMKSEARELESVSLRLMNQIEQLESQGSILLAERNGAMADTHKMEAALSACELERDTAKEWHDSTLRTNAVKTPSLVQNSAASTVNLGPDAAVEQWQPAPHEKKYFGTSRMFPNSASTSAGSPRAALTASSQKSSTPDTASCELVRP